MTLRHGIISAVALMAFAPLAHASWSYQFASPDAGYLAAPNSTIQVPVYLYEQAITPTTTSQIQADSGLWSAGLGVQRTSGTGTLSTLVSDPAFDDTGMRQYTTSASAATIWEFTLNQYSGPLPENLGGGVFRVKVADVPVTVGSLAGEVSTFTLKDRDPSTTDTITAANLLTLDPTQTTTFSVTVVPEPASMALIAPATMLLLRRRRH